MVKCRAIKDGLIGTNYISAGEEFLAEVCPGWAEELCKDESTKKPRAKKPGASKEEKAD